MLTKLNWAAFSPNKVYLARSQRKFISFCDLVFLFTKIIWEFSQNTLTAVPRFV